MFQATAVGISLLTGCTVRSSDSGYVSTTEGDNENVQSLTVTDQDTLSEKYEVAIDASVIESTYTEQHPGRVEVTFRNTGDETRRFVFADTPPFSYPFSRPTGLVLKTVGHEAEHREPGCWQEEVETDPKQGDYTAAWRSRRELDPGEALTETYEVWGDPRIEEECVPTGTFRMESDEYEIRQDGDETEFRWGFGLEVVK
jgi:hypothetical protein